MVAAGNTTTLRDRLDALVQHRVLAAIDRHFAMLVGELDDHAHPDIVLSAALLSAEHRAGHTCLLLDKCAGRRITEIVARSRESAAAGADAPTERLPERSAWLRALERSSMVATFDDADSLDPAGSEPLPLVYDGDGRLYLHRLFDAERFLAQRLRELASASPSPTGDSSQPLPKLFVGAAQEEQIRAANIAANRRLCIVTGGPGTGKTTLAARIVALLVHSELAQPSRIALAAPTGKAAARLQESMGSQLEELSAKVPALGGHVFSATTIHRLLQTSGRVKALDALIVDECSMVDLSVMRRLVDELPPNVRLILLGDAAQLASVQPGRVFGDICAAGADCASPLHDCFVKLTKNHRFDPKGGIGRMAAAVENGQVDEAVAAMSAGGNELACCQLDKATEFDEFACWYADEHIAPLVKMLREDNATVTTPFPCLRVLCAHRNGPFGTDRFNFLVENHLRESGLIDEASAKYYVGRPIIVTRNDRDTNLSNGDTGVVVSADGKPRVWFKELDNRLEDGERFLVSLARLPEHESFFALNVHRAQGSEYEEVAYVPGPPRSRIATRELLYTALTRARNKVVVYGKEEAIGFATGEKTTRASGLQARLLGG